MTKRTITIIAVLALLASPALAQQSTSRAYYDRNGSFAGSSTTHGNQTTFTDRAGKFEGTSIRNSDGTTSHYDRAGRFIGSTTTTTTPR
jgi:hypothetical protein